MGREVTKTPDTKLRSSTRRHVGQEHTLLYYATQSVVRALTYADQGPGPTLTSPFLFFLKLQLEQNL